MLNSRRKGARGERELAGLITAAGFAARRDGRLDSDLDHTIPDVHLEVKRSERPRLLEWCEQAERDAGRQGVRTWAVAWRCNRRAWTVTLPLDEYLRLKLIEAATTVVDEGTL